MLFNCNFLLLVQSGVTLTHHHARDADVFVRANRWGGLEVDLGCRTFGFEFQSELVWLDVLDNCRGSASEQPLAGCPYNTHGGCYGVEESVFKQCLQEYCVVLHNRIAYREEWCVSQSHRKVSTFRWFLQVFSVKEC